MPAFILFAKYISVTSIEENQEGMYRNNVSELVEASYGVNNLQSSAATNAEADGENAEGIQRSFRLFTSCEVTLSFSVCFLRHILHLYSSKSNGHSMCFTSLFH